jgi:hypothetical protein
MVGDQISCSVVSSLLFISVYLGLSFRYKQRPELAHAVIIAMSCSGVVAAIGLGTLAYFSPPEALGVLRDSKASILIGTLAMTWVSIASMIASVLHPRRDARR